MSIHQVVVVFHVCKIVVDAVIYECYLHFFARARFLQSHKIGKVVVYKIFGGCETCRVRESTHVVITTKIYGCVSWRVNHLCLTLVVAVLTSSGY